MSAKYRSPLVQFEHGTRIYPPRSGERIARDAANRKIRELLDAHVAAVDAEREELERRLLAAPPLPLGSTASDRIARDASFRDALDRAGRTPREEPANLVDLLQRALRSDDTLQARAALAVAFERCNLEAIYAYIEAEPAPELTSSCSTS